MFSRLIRSTPSPRLHAVLPLLVVFVGLAVLGASTASAATVTLRWQDNSANESGFRVERATGSGSFAQVATTAAGVTSYTDGNAAASTTYRYRVRAYNSAGSSSYSNITTITTGSSTGNTAPTISSISSRTIPVNGTTGPIAFTIGDAQTSAANLTLIKNASNTSLVPLSGITFGGSGANRTVTIKPAANKSGWSTIWVKVSDGSLSKYVSFKLTVSTSSTGGASTSANTAPTISSIGDRTIAVNGTTGAISFTIADSQTSASSLTLIKSASDTSLVPLGNITFGGSGANRTVTIKPASNKTGWSTIWVKVSDGLLDRYTSFVVNVIANLTSTNIGSAGSTSLQSTSATSGDNLWFSYLPLAGDAEITVHVADLSSTAEGTRGGLMFRESVATDAAFAGVHVSGAGRIGMTWRATKGAALQSVSPLTGTAPQWLRLTRSGDSIFAFTSSDGANWEFVEMCDVALPGTALAGTAATNGGGASAATATFTNIAVD